MNVDPADDQAQARCRRCGTVLSQLVVHGLCAPCLGKSIFAIEEEAPLPESSPNREFRKVGNYNLIERIARGGMGVVYRARQDTLGREVAVKILLDSTFASEAESARFKAEATAAAALHHPNIVGIHEIGEDQGQHYFSMDLVNGQDLGAVVRDRPMPSRQAAELLSKVADAVQHAHEQGVLHRDLKPSNVLVDHKGEPHVTDFGLAKRFRSPAEDNLTLTGQVIGTPGYMPPEQALAHRDLGPAADIYSLGALLYHVLSGRAPFVGETPTAILRQVEENDPVPLRLLNPSVPRDLETICLKCLAKTPSRRYATAGEFRDELLRFLRGEPIRARPVSSLESAVRWCQRRPRVAALAALSLFLLVAVIVVTAAARIRLAEQERAVRRKDYVADMRLVDAAIQENNIGQAIRLLGKWAPQPSSRGGRAFSNGAEDLRSFEWYYFQDRCQSDELFTLGIHTNHAVRVAFSHDDRRVASVGSDGDVRLWDLQTKRLVGTGQHTKRILALAFSSEDEFVATGSDDCTVSLWDGKSLEPNGAPLSHNSAIVALAFDSARRQLLVQARQEFVCWDLTSRTPLWRRPMPVPTWFYGAFSPRLDALALPMPRTQGVRIWPVPPVKERGAVGNLGVAVAFSPDNQFLAEGDFDGMIRVWDQRTLQQIVAIQAHTGLILALAWSPDGRVLASGGRDEFLKTWSMPDGMPLGAYHGHQGLVASIAFSGSGDLIASASTDGSIRLWDAKHPPKPRDNPTHETNILAFLRHGMWVSLEKSYSDVAWIDPRGIQELPIPVPKEFTGSNTTVRAINHGFVVFGPDAVARRFSLAGQRTGREIPLPRWPMGMIFTSPDGEWVAWRDRDVEITDSFLWKLGGKAAPTPLGPTGTVWLLPTFSPDNRTMVAADLEGRLAIWDLVNPPRVRQMRGLHSVVTGIQFSRDGHWLAVSGEEGITKLWDTQNWHQPPLSLEAGQKAIWCVDISPDHKRVAGGGDNGTVFLWDIHTQEMLAKLRTGQPGLVEAVGFSADGNELFGVGANGFFVWHATADRRLQP